MVLPILLCFVFYTQHIQAENPISLSFNELQSIPTHKKNAIQQGTRISISGFLYHTSEGQWILSPHAHLKSCCIGALDKVREQIVIDFASEPSHVPRGRVITLEGLLNLPSQEDQLSADKVQISLHNATWNDSKPKLPLSLLVGFGASLCIVTWMLMRKRQAKL